ncbi:hypothetical protein RYX36_037012 [Vicia faba]
MAKSCSPPSFHKLRNNKQQWSFEKAHVHKCEFCHKVFTTGQALGGHKTCHRSKRQQIHDDDEVNKGHKTIKITFSLSTSPSCNAKQKRHSWTRVLKSTVHHPPTASTLKPTDVHHPPTASTLKPTEQELPDVDLLSLLPPRFYNTKKRSRRYLVDDGLANNTAPIPLLDTSPESVANLDLNHPDRKRMKLSSNGNDTEIEMMQKQHVLPTAVKEEKNLNGGENSKMSEGRLDVNHVFADVGDLRCLNISILIMLLECDEDDGMKRCYRCSVNYFCADIILKFNRGLIVSIGEMQGIAYCRLQVL